jgi:4-diphosphocytidyl-2-C-methyl-D-erythritol kinase
MFNRLESTAHWLCPKVRQLRERFEQLDCLAHQMTGSGTAYFALCRNARQARQLASQLRLENMGEIFVAHTATSAIFAQHDNKGGNETWKSPMLKSN